MLQLTVPDAPQQELWDEKRCEFVIRPPVKGATLQLEHSLMTVAKWEAKWHKSFTSTHEKTVAEFIDYIKCMTLTKDVNPEIYNNLTSDNLKQIDEYIKDPMTATTIRRRPGKGASRKVVTAEVIYSWMVDCGIPFEPCQKWHLNRLITLIEVCRENDSGGGKKMSKRDILKSNAALNASRRAKAHSRG